MKTSHTVRQAVAVVAAGAVMLSLFGGRVGAAAPAVPITMTVGSSGTVAYFATPNDVEVTVNGGSVSTTITPGTPASVGVGPSWGYALSVNTDTWPGGSGNCSTQQQTQVLTYPITIGGQTQTVTQPVTVKWVCNNQANIVLSTGSTATFTVNGETVQVTPAAFQFQEPANMQAGSNQIGFTVTIPLAPTTTTVTSNLNPSAVGQPVVFTAHVTSPNGTPTGTVTFYDGSTTIGTASLDASGTASLSDASLSIATHSITAVYAGDGTFAGSTSAVYAQNVTATPTTTVVTASAPSAPMGKTITLTATVSAANGQTPTGSVTFAKNGVPFATGALSNGQVTTTAESRFVPGSYRITASYSGATTFAPSTSAQVTIQVGEATPVVTLAASATSVQTGQPVTFTATVDAGFPNPPVPPDGDVRFFDGSVILGDAQRSMTSSSVTFTTSALGAGTHTITATFLDDGWYVSATSPPVVVTVTPMQAATTTSLTASTTAPVAGQSVTLTARVSTGGTGGATPTGSVTFYDAGSALGVAGLDSGGGATFATSALAVGSHAITAVYSGDADFATSTSAPVSVTVGQAGTTTALVTSPTSPVFGQGVTLTATVTVNAPGAGTPTGSVGFYDGTTELGSATVSGAGNAVYTAPSLSPGDHAITAVYSGDADFATSTSAPVSVTVGQAQTATSVTSSNPSAEAGQAVTFAAQVSVEAPGAGTPTGAVAFYDGTTLLGSVPLGSDGTAAFTSSGLAVGTHSVTAVYSGDADFSTSSSPSVSQVITAVPTTTGLTSSANPSLPGQTLTFTATVNASASAVGAPTGTVAFYDGATLLGTVPLASNGHASFTTSALSVGTHAITAVYDGDGVFATSTSSVLSQAVQLVPTTLTLVSQTQATPPCWPGGDDHGTAHCLPSIPGLGDFDHLVLPSAPNTSVLGQAVTFTATLSVAGGVTAVPTGSITFAAGGATLGTVPLKTINGVARASLTLATLPAGPNTVTATYTGDATFQSSTASLTQKVQYLFIGLLPPFDIDMPIEADRTVPIVFTLLDAHGRIVRDATASLEVNGRPAVPAGPDESGSQFVFRGMTYQYDLRLASQGVTSGTATLTITLSDGTTHTVRLTVRQPGRSGRPHPGR